MKHFTDADVEYAFSRTQHSVDFFWEDRISLRDLRDGVEDEAKRDLFVIALLLGEESNWRFTREKMLLPPGRQPIFLARVFEWYGDREGYDRIRQEFRVRLEEGLSIKYPNWRSIWENFCSSANTQDVSMGWDRWWEIQPRALTTWFYGRYLDMQKGDCPSHLFGRWLAKHEQADFPSFMALAGAGWDGAGRALTGLTS